ncbi:MAG: YkgJ family cysteine cluster protein [Candidatus Omnitrophica bacterium]|nr:YkgJ family cysteine cluster protein [Candidatus Omnitrophota bacterium]
MNQFVPSEYCLKCRGCCRFRDQNSVWSPCLLDEEIVDFADNKEIPAVSVSLTKHLDLVSAPGEDGYLCPFLNPADNICKAYLQRPFECQLYPFLLNLRYNKVILTIDLNCPYAKEKMNTPEFKEYAVYLAEFLNSSAQMEILKGNPHVLQAYEEVKDIVELNFPDTSH